MCGRKTGHQHGILQITPQGCRCQHRRRGPDQSLDSRRAETALAYAPNLRFSRIRFDSYDRKFVLADHLARLCFSTMLWHHADTPANTDYHLEGSQSDGEADPEHPRRSTQALVERQATFAGACSPIARIRSLGAERSNHRIKTSTAGVKAEKEDSDRRNRTAGKTAA